jgi:bacillithiol system protein YtxJ
MFKWFRKMTNQAEIQEVGSDTDLDKLLHQDLVVLFKHSTACPVSWAAHGQVSRFHEHNPDVPVFLVPVIQQRQVSRAIAERTEVWHESPQVIVMRKGEVVESVSHGAITENRLAALVAQAAAQ